MPRPLPTSDSLPYALYTAAQVRALDQAAIASGMPGGALMARAGEAAYQRLRARWPEARRITLLCGAGNNGGDGYVLARLARADGLDVTLLQLGDVSQLGADAQGMLEAWLGMGGRLEAFQELPRRSDVIVDALLGIGLERPVAGEWARAVEAVNAKVAQQLRSGEYEARTFYVLGDAASLALARASMDPVLDRLERFDNRWVLAPGWQRQPAANSALR